jgi:hypothetical protein
MREVTLVLTAERRSATCAFLSFANNRIEVTEARTQDDSDFMSEESASP